MNSIRMVLTAPGGPRAEGSSSRRCTGLGCPEWWSAVPKDERVLLVSVVRMIQSAKRSRVPGVARAARKWELSLSCFLKVRLMNSCRRAGGCRWRGGRNGSYEHKGNGKSERRQ